MGYEKVKTNPKNGSVAKVRVERVAFSNLWKNYPDDVQHLGKDGKDPYENHCAIKVSHALLASKLSMTSFPGAKCNGSCSPTQKHALRAQELADWLSHKPFENCPTPLVATGQTFETMFNDKRGIVFFKDYWQRKGQTGEVRTGDHIDLWEDKTLASIGSLESFARINLGISWDGWFSDFKKSTQVLLWEIP